MTASNPIAELSHVVKLSGLAAEPVNFSIEATAEEREILCKRLDLRDLSLLCATVDLTICGPQRVRADVSFKANVVQSCVVTLDPVPATVEERFSQECSYETASMDSIAGSAADVWVEPEEELEILADDRLDLGELVTQHFSLALDPYPRKSGVSFDGYRTDKGPPTAAFAALSELKVGAARKRG
jgi:uncharacterized metal-binding protein YceD (DUF177 family)